MEYGWKRVFAAALFALLLFALPVHAVAGPDVRALDATFDGKITPGAESTLTITLENVGAFPCAYKVTTQLIVSPPLSLTGFDSKIIDSFCAPDKPTVTFKVKADANAAAASYPITVVTTYESEFRAAYSTTNTVYARVEGSPQIVATPVKTTPVNVYPGDDFTLELNVGNIGAYRADSLTLALNAEKPLEVKSSTQTQSAASIAPRTSVSKTYSMHVPKDAQAKDYALTLDARYLDENGQWKTQSLPLMLTVKQKAVFDVLNINSVGFIDSRNNPITFTIKNTGTDVARRVRAKLLPTFPFSTQGSVQYFDDLSPGEEKTVTFYTDVDKDGIPGLYSLDLSVTWENADTEKFSDTVPVSVGVAYTPLFNAIFLNYWYVWVIAIAAFVVMQIRKRKAKSGTEKAKSKG